MSNKISFQKEFDFQAPTRSQFGQHFARNFFVRKLRTQLFCAYVLGLYFTGVSLPAQKLRVERWWNQAKESIWPTFWAQLFRTFCVHLIYRFVLLWRKNISTKAALKMLVRLMQCRSLLEKRDKGRKNHSKTRTRILFLIWSTLLSSY